MSSDCVGQLSRLDAMPRSAYYECRLSAFGAYALVVRYRAGAWRGETVSKEHISLIERLLCRVSSGRITRDSRSTLAVCFDEEGLHLKMAKPKGLFWRLEYGMTGGRIRRAFRNGLRLKALGLPCVEMVLWGVEGMVFARRGVLISRLVRGEPLSADADDAIMRRVGAVLAAYHNCGVLHGDMKPPNILVSGADVVLADYDNTRFYGKPLKGRRCWVDLGRLERALGRRFEAVVEGYAAARKLTPSAVRQWREAEP